jgi:hypothetical protein
VRPSGWRHRRNEVCKSELGLTYTQLCVVVAVVVRWRQQGRPAGLAQIEELTTKVEDIRSPGDHIRTLVAQGWLVRYATVDSFLYFKPTDRAIRNVEAWAGRQEAA